MPDPREPDEIILDDIPMNRYSNPIPTCPEHSGQTRPFRAGDFSCELDQMLSLLSQQNQLLTDLLSTVNSLTAALLVRPPR